MRAFAATGLTATGFVGKRTSNQAEKPPSLLSAEFLALMATASAFALGVGAMNALMPPFVVDELGGTEATSGLVMGSIAFTALLSRSVLGRASDRQGSRRLIGMGAAVMALAFVLLVAVDSVAGAVGVRLLQGAGGAAFFIGTTVRAMELAAHDRRSQAAAFNLISFHIGMGTGPLAGEWVAGRFGYDAAWLVCAVLSTGAVGLSWLLSHRPGDPDAEPSPLVHPNAIGPGLVTLFGVVAFNGFLMFAALYSDEIGMENVGPVFLVSSGTMIVARVLFGRVPDIVGPIRAGTGALVLTVLAAAVTGLWATPTGLYLGAGLLALGLSMQSPSFMVIAVDGIAEQHRGSAMATYTAFFDIANAMVGPAFGVIVTTSGYRAAFLVAAACAAVALVILRLFIAPGWHRAVGLAASGPGR